MNLCFHHSISCIAVAYDCVIASINGGKWRRDYSGLFVLLLLGEVNTVLYTSETEAIKIDDYLLSQVLVGYYEVVVNFEPYSEWSFFFWPLISTFTILRMAVKEKDNWFSFLRLEFVFNTSVLRNDLCLLAR